MMNDKTKQAQAKREQRIKARIFSMIKDRNALFITMTFNDDILRTTSAETRKRYIKRFLKEETALYIANIDFGKKTNREHYHAIIKTDTITKVNNRYKHLLNKVNFKAYKYGNLKADFIAKKYGFKNDEELKQTAKRLYEHIFKESTKGNKPIFSRGIPSEEQQIKRLKRFYQSEQEQERTKAHTLNDEEYIKMVIEETDNEIMKASQELGLISETKGHQESEQIKALNWWKHNNNFFES